MKSPRILIVYKRSPLLVAGTSAAAKNERFCRNHACHYAALKQVASVLKAQGLDFHQHLRGSKVQYTGYDIIISVGGDGTFLEAARHSTPKQLILGVNSDPSWSVGQFCATDACGFEKLLLRNLRKPGCKKLSKLRVTFLNERKSRSIECLNDVLFCHANPASMSRYSITIGKKTEEQRSSGVWFSSAAGSTGAIFSAGGVKLPLESRSVQYIPRELYHAKKNAPYHLKGGVLKPGASIVIASQTHHGRVFIDGAHIKYPLTFGQKIRIELSSDYVQMIHA